MIMKMDNLIEFNNALIYLITKYEDLKLHPINHPFEVDLLFEINGWGINRKE